MANLQTFWAILATISMTLLAALLGILGVRAIARSIGKAIAGDTTIHPERKQHINTLASVIQWVLDIVIVTLALLMVLGRFIDITPMLTGLGVLGIAISLGSQSLVQDFLGGMFILLENQYNVGDVIEVEDRSGSVERLTLRATYLRDNDGKLHIIPNGEIRTVANVTKDWSRAIAKIGIAYEEDLDRALALIERVSLTVTENPEYAAAVLEPPQILAPSLDDWAVTITIWIKTRPGQQWVVERALKKALLGALKEAHIQCPYPRQEIILLKD